jgi:hypothetical protein
MMDENVKDSEPSDDEVRRFVLEATRERVAYLKFIKTRGYAVDEDQIARFEEEIRIEAAKLGESDSDVIGEGCVSELQLELAFADLDYDIDDNIDDENRDALKALLFRDNQLTVKMWQEQRHPRAHFHVELKNRYSASYAVDNFQLLAGEMPAKYERIILNWASRYQASLAATWQRLNAGEDVRELIIIPAERIEPEQ